MHSSSKQPGATFKNRGKALNHDESDKDEDFYSEIAPRITCMPIQKRQPYKRCEEYCGDEYGQWRMEQMKGAERLEKELKGRWSMEDLIDEQVKRFQAQYSSIPTKLIKDVAEVLMPKWAPPRELAALSWLGDWRPSAIPRLLHSLIHAGTLPESRAVKTVLPLLMEELRAEEAVIEEEMAEIQANCIFHLPLGMMRKKKGGVAALACVHTEFKKVHQVLIKAQNLRVKAMHVSVKKVVSPPTDAAQFLVAFARLQDLIHQHAMRHHLIHGPVSVLTA
ncbi:unnamed protein product [Cuscuta europaea]|uniref:DOG1 domain-containing protein n=1 Tax=Cuscuta europaea TaxID=41803 RepID=A0A9P1E734_CUSEU|nr:unnamed protein product [Cuscuta europaea]